MTRPETGPEAGSCRGRTRSSELVTGSGPETSRAVNGTSGYIHSKLLFLGRAIPGPTRGREKWLPLRP